MSTLSMIDAIFSVVIILATSLAGIAWRRVDRADERVREIELLLAGKAKFVNEEILDRKLRPINQSLGRILRWIEAQNGTISSMAHSDDP